MFKKEAHEFQKQIQQEYLDLGKNGAYPPLWERIGELWGKGAEHGYNKANEWYYPSKGEYPKTKKKVLVLLKDVEEPILDYYRQDGLWNYALEKEVIAWKEIVLPKEV